MVDAVVRDKDPGWFQTRDAGSCPARKIRRVRAEGVWASPMHKIPRVETRSEGNCLVCKTQLAGTSMATSVVEGKPQCCQLRGLRPCITMVTRPSVYYTDHVTILTSSLKLIRWILACITVVTGHCVYYGGITSVWPLPAFYFTAGHALSALAHTPHTTKLRPGGCHGPPRFWLVLSF